MLDVARQAVGLVGREHALELTAGVAVMTGATGGARRLTVNRRDVLLDLSRLILAD
jgi:hypothetical protein